MRFARFLCQFEEVIKTKSSDVLDMDACHILLGRSWQYDVQAVHRGRENTYEFQWMNNKIVLMPLSKKTMELIRRRYFQIGDLVIAYLKKKRFLAAPEKREACQNSINCVGE